MTELQRIHSHLYVLALLLHMCSCTQNNKVIWWLVHKGLTLSNDIQTPPRASTRGLGGQNTVICMKLSIQASVNIVSKGSLSNYHDDNDNVKRQLVLRAKQLLCTCITLLSTFLWRPLHDYDTSNFKCKHRVGTVNARIYTWNLPMQCFVKGVDIQREIVLSLFEHG